MLMKDLIKPKAELTTVREDATLEEALTVLETSGFRCVPILDATGNIYRGNIYKMHIYRHKSRGGDMQLPVTHLLKNATKFVTLNSQFFTVFFAIRDLPYITVLDENNRFYGILTHNRLLKMLSQSWNVDIGSYVLTVTSPDERGDLVSIAKIITKYTAIASCMTLDIRTDGEPRRTMFTLPADVTPTKLNKIVANLKRKHFDVPEIENLRE
ncbi:cyclic di-AMP binding protein CbpA [Ligilactobacillus hohenheimensis]|uniref:cyclic di-AMP binding protein CbpA n=1 Tax=Ligilactobacillus hohenheimensis TaxID=2991832 RepID=UPI001F8D5543|nr:cyclic di-AMP binding protein CbpA [Ligilactobacillus hohenheimensis]HJC03510.1 CBS domain-containing protein [Candidatus Ligilactobacillus avistercoris]